MSFLTLAKRAFIGKPIASKHALHQRLPVYFALPVFASDALSSVAYATENMMYVLVAAGTGLLHLTFPISLAIGLLIVIVASSYYQTVHSYPNGGGSYIVASDNLGSIWGRVAGASILIDYVLTVAVSVTAGVLALVSMAPHLQPYVVQIDLLCLFFVAVMNLRGAKESGAVFAIPTYSFVVLVFGLIIVGLFRLPHLDKSFTNSIPSSIHPEAFGIFLLLKAFANGCTALTGIEAISDGVQAFKKPEARNASITLAIMAAILVCMFMGSSWLAQSLHVVPMSQDDHQYKTVLALICTRVFGHGVYFFALQVFTALILILAANTAFADFPRLSSIISRDGFLPRQFASVGDRLVFQNGIIVLTILASVLILVFKGHTDALIPLYAIGVFTAFTLSQFGMVVHQFKRKKYTSMTVSLVGGITTGVVTGIILATKTAEGGWIVLVALAVLLSIFYGVRKHYTYLANELSLTPDDSLKPVTPSVLLLVPRIYPGIKQAINYAKSMTKNVSALHVRLEGEDPRAVEEEWKKYGSGIELEIVESDGNVPKTITDYIDGLTAGDPTAVVTVIVPQELPKHWWQGLFRTKSAKLKAALKSRKNVIITNVPASDSVKPVHQTVLLLVPRLHKGILRAISYAKSMTDDVRGIHVTLDAQSANVTKDDWNKFGADIPLVILESPYRSLLEPLTEYIDEAMAEHPDSLITIIVPQAVPKHWWQGLLHNNAAVPLKMALKSRKNVVVTNVRYFLK